MLAAFTAITSIVVARFFGPELRGQFATATALLNSSVSIAVLGTPAFLAKYVADLERGHTRVKIDVVRTCILLTAVSSFLAMILMLLLSQLGEPLSIDRNGQIAIVAFIACGVLSVLFLNISLGQANWFSFNLSRLLFGGGTVITVLGYLIAGGNSLSGLLVCLAIANGISVLAQLLFLRPLRRQTAGWWQSGRAVFVGSKYYALNSIANMSTGYADILVLSYMFPPSQVGFWAVARSVAALLSPINNALSVKVFSVFARQEDGMLVFGQMVRNLLLFNATTGLVLCFSAQHVIDVIFGSDYMTSSFLVPFAVAVVIASSFSELVEERLRGSGRPGPVNVSRFMPIVALFFMLGFSQYIKEVWQFALILTLGHCLRGGLALFFLRAPNRKKSFS